MDDKTDEFPLIPEIFGTIGNLLDYSQAVIYFESNFLFWGLFNYC
jgi:hypothetical protein